jgi:hypothetical protein
MVKTVQIVGLESTWTGVKGLIGIFDEATLISHCSSLESEGVA